MEINGDTYDGEWKNDKRLGKGIFIDINGDMYEEIGLIARSTGKVFTRCQMVPRLTEIGQIIIKMVLLLSQKNGKEYSIIYDNVRFITIKLSYNQHY